MEFGKPFFELGSSLLQCLGLLGMCVQTNTPASSRAGPGRSLQGHGNVQHLLPFAAQQCTPFTEQEDAPAAPAGSLLPAVILALKTVMFARQRARWQGRAV